MVHTHYVQPYTPNWASCYASQSTTSKNSRTYSSDMATDWHHFGLFFPRAQIGQFDAMRRAVLIVES